MLVFGHPAQGIGRFSTKEDGSRECSTLLPQEWMFSLFKLSLTAISHPLGILQLTETL